jgi:S-methylmethionine-dependent homocysteine/selenocysteine methylase
MEERSFVQAVRDDPFILTDGGIETRIVYGTSYRLDPELEVAKMVGDPAGRPLLHQVYAGYAAVARDFDLPLILGTPTFRASPDRVRRAGLVEADAVRKVNADCKAFLDEVRGEFAGTRIYLAGVIGPRGDAYRPEEGLPVAAAQAYHRAQAEAPASCGVDFLFAPTFPSIEEATGVALAMAATGLPHVVSFVLRPDGTVMDGTPLAEGIQQIDRQVDPPPLYYSISCVYPTLAERGLAAAASVSQVIEHRVRETKANASPLSAAELDRLGHLDAAPPEVWAAAMWPLYERFGLRILGGCCGTDDRHIRALAARMAAARPA